MYDDMIDSRYYSWWHNSALTGIEDGDELRIYPCRDCRARQPPNVRCHFMTSYRKVQLQSAPCWRNVSFLKLSTAYFILRVPNGLDVRLRDFQVVPNFNGQFGRQSKLVQRSATLLEMHEPDHNYSSYDNSCGRCTCKSFLIVLDLKNVRHFFFLFQGTGVVLLSFSILSLSSVSINNYFPFFFNEGCHMPDYTFLWLRSNFITFNYR